MSGRVEVGIGIPQLADGPRSIPHARAVLGRAEALGYHSAWVVEGVGSVRALAPLEVLAFAAALTGRMKLGAAVLLTALRSPVHLANSLATLDHLSGARLIVGVGLGDDRTIYPAHGLTPDGRAARFAEGVRVITRLWTEDRVSLDGRFFTLRDVTIEPKPLQNPHPPIWFGGHHPDALRRAVELGSGFIGGGGSSTSQFAHTVGALRTHLAAAGRDPGAFPVAKRVYLAVDRDRDRAGRRLADWFATFYGRAGMAAEVAVFGGEQECLDGLADVVRSGAGLLILNPVFDELEHVERLSADILPRL